MAIQAFKNKVTGLGTSFNIFKDVTGTITNPQHVGLDGENILVAYIDGSDDLKVFLAKRDTTTEVITNYYASVQTLAGTYTLQRFLQLSATKALAILRNTTNGYISCAVVSFTAPTTVAIASAVESTLDADTGSINADLLDTDKVVIGYKDTSDTYPKAVICSISGTTPSFGTAVAAKAAATGAYSISVCKVTTTSFAMSYDVSATYYAQILSVSGTTITTNSESSSSISATNNGGAATPSMTLKMLSATQIVGVFAQGKDTINSADYGVVITYSGVTISAWNSGSMLTSTRAYGLAIHTKPTIVALGSTHFITLHTGRDGSYNALTGLSLCRVTGTSYSVLASASALATCSSFGHSLQLIDSTHVTFQLATEIYKLSIFNNSTYGYVYPSVAVASASSNKQIEVSLLLLGDGISGAECHLYLNSVNPENKIVEFAKLYSPSDHNNVDQDVGTSNPQADIVQGILRLPNSPIVISNGDVLLAVTTNVGASIYASGIERDI